MDSSAFNYDADACFDDGSCVEIIYGCTDPTMWNYDSTANTDDGSCVAFVFGCTDLEATNYDPLANEDLNGILCNYEVYGCTDPTAFNYDAEANTNQVSAEDTSDPCIPFIFGCTDENALNYNPFANTGFGGLFCEYPIYGCAGETNVFSINYGAPSDPVEYEAWEAGTGDAAILSSSLPCADMYHHH